MIYYIPLEHIEQRYTIHIDRDIEDYLQLTGIKYTKINPPKLKGDLPEGMFLNAAETILTKSHQINQIAQLYQQGLVTNDDTFFFSDIWFPGIESLAYLNYFHKVNPKITGFIHAGSFTDTDFVRDMERWAKNFEDIVFDIADTVFCASNFIKNDIIKKRFINPDKLVVSGLPIDSNIPISTTTKEDIVVFNGRLCDEKQPWMFDELAKRFPQVQFVKTQELNLSREDYYKLLSKAKVVVSFALQENFGFGIAEAVKLGCVPVVPNRLVYPELYPAKYLYNNFDECVDKTHKAIEGYLGCPKITYQSPFKIWFNETNLSR